MERQDGCTPLPVFHAGREVAPKDVVSEEKVFKGSSHRVARATDPHCLHHTYMCMQKDDEIINCALPRSHIILWWW